MEEKTKRKVGSNMTNIGPERIKNLIRTTGDFLHVKSNNTYTQYGFATPEEFPSDIIANERFIARDSEDKDLEVVCYIRGNSVFFIPSDNPKLFGNTDLKVLYERNGIFWLRSVGAFEELVEINGVQVPRFQKL
jgi:hypothetical protein